MSRYLAEEVSSGPHEAAAEHDAVADDAAKSYVERAYHVAVTLQSHSTEAAVAIGYSLSYHLVLRVAYQMPAWRKDAEDNVAAANNMVSDS